MKLAKIHAAVVAAVCALSMVPAAFAGGGPTYTIPTDWTPQKVADAVAGDDTLPWVLAALTAITIITLGVALFKGLLGKTRRIFGSR